MSLKFNVDRPKVSDDEINRHKNFKDLVERFKQQSLKKAQGDESWWKNKVVRYTTVIAGVTVVCTVTLALIQQQQKQNQSQHDKISTSSTQTNKVNSPARSAPAAPFVNPPKPSLKTPVSKYKIDAAKGGQITHNKATTIKVPANGFVDKKGVKISGEVSIEYREFHDLADAMVNGINMAYDSAGFKYNLETAGMFEIKGVQNGEPVFIAPEKTIEIQLASKTAENRFNQYYLDTIERNWKYIQKDEVRPLTRTASVNENERIRQLENEIKVVIPQKIDSSNKHYQKKIVSLPSPAQPKRPNAATKGRPSFKLDGSYAEFPELSTFKNVVFEVGPENKNYSSEINEITWSDVKISQGPVKGVNYLLTLKYRQRTENLVVYPVLSGTDLERAKSIYDQKLLQYETVLEKRNADEKRLLKEMQDKQAAFLASQKLKEEELKAFRARQAEVRRAETDLLQAARADNSAEKFAAIRVFRVSSFGIFNSDCPQNVPKGKNVDPVFITENNQPIMPATVFLIDHVNKTVYTLDRNQGFRTKVDESGEYSFCLFKNNEVYICKKEIFNMALSSSGNKFRVQAISGRADNVEDLKKSLEL